MIDGSHKFEDVLLDAKNSINNINENGIIIFDDFNWFHYKNEKENPAHRYKFDYQRKFTQV